MNRSAPGRLAVGLGASARAAAATMIVVLPTFWSMRQLGAWWRPSIDAIVFAVMLAVALPRALARASWGQVPLAVALFPVACAGAVGCSMLLGAGGGWRAAGVALFSAGVAIPVWMRRLGITWRTGGTLAALPFLAVLVQPMPVEQTWAFLGWLLLGAGIALTWALLARSLTATDPAAAETRTTRRTAGWNVSTRMAIQLGCATAAAFGVAQALDSDHLVWPVLTVLIVHSGNRGRGDVLVKGVQRIVGALAGTGIAALASGLFGAGDSTALVVLFATLALAAAVRPYGYAYWAAGITASLAFLYGYFGQSSIDLLGHRLLGILAGGTLAIAAAWFLLPVRTLDVARLRLAQLLATAADTVGAAGRAESTAEPARRLYAAGRELATLDATAHAAHRFGLGAARGLEALLTDAHELTRGIRVSVSDPTNQDRAELGQLARELAAAARRFSDKRSPLITTDHPYGDTPLAGVLGKTQNVRGTPHE